MFIRWNIFPLYTNVGRNIFWFGIRRNSSCAEMGIIHTKMCHNRLVHDVSLGISKLQTFAMRKCKCANSNIRSTEELNLEWIWCEMGERRRWRRLKSIYGIWKLEILMCSTMHNMWLCTDQRCFGNSNVPYRVVTFLLLVYRKITLLKDYNTKSNIRKDSF